MYHKSTMDTAVVCWWFLRYYGWRHNLNFQHPLDGVHFNIPSSVGHVSRIAKPENKLSSLLTPEENELAFTLLGPNRLTKATTVVALFTTRGKDSAYWYYERIGVLCFVKDESRKSYFLVILCLAEKREVWEHEIYENMDYMAPKQFFQVFEAEDYIAAFNFVDEREAFFFYKTVIKEMKNEKRRRNNNAEKSKTQTTDAKSPQNKRKKGVIDKSDIGRPANFQHVLHIGWDAKLQKFLQRAGVSDNDLKDKDMWTFVLKFISDNGGMEMVAQAVDGTPRELPDYPPSPTPDRLSPKEIQNGSPPPADLILLPPQAFPLPPPPPPSDLAPPPHHFVPDDLMPPQDILANDPRSALRDAILNLSKQHLQPVNNYKPKDPRNNLLADIQNGVVLKPVAKESLRTKTTHASRNSKFLPDILRAAISERFKVMNPDQDEPEESTTEDWSLDVDYET